MSEPQTIKINEVEYVRKDSILSQGVSLDGMPYCIVRTQSAGVFAGYIKSRNGEGLTMVTARRIWYWVGAASLSQLSQEGVSKPKECKFPVAVPLVDLFQVIEILPCSQKAIDSIAGVPIWKM